MFLDIEMPGMNGINYLKQLHPKIMVILTTAYSEYALESFELNIVDYLLKPIKLDRFIKAVNKAKEYHDLVSHQSIIQQSEDHFFIKSERSFIRLQFQDILYIKGLKDYVVIHIPDKKYMTAMNLSTVLQQLPNQEFARVSKSFIINVKHITRIDLDEIYVGDTVIPLGSSYKEDFLDRYVSGSLLKRI
jgi:DNA-binding LytR/AlgR family response regulator